MTTEKLKRAEHRYMTVVREALSQGMLQAAAEALGHIAYAQAAKEDRGAKVIRGDAQTGWEQVVMCEMIIPDVPNSWGDVYSVEAVKEFAYEFLRQGYIIDINHDQEDIGGVQAVVVESFIARRGDPDFIEGSWVVAMKILDATLWQRILDGEINGYSYEALCVMQPIVFQNLRNRQIAGVTEPDPIDGHVHDFLVMLNAFNKPVSGATGVNAGHSHRIVTHTVTEAYTDILGRSHSHRYQVIDVKGDSNGTGQ